MGGYCNEHTICISENLWVTGYAALFDFWSYDLAQWMGIESYTEDIPLPKDNNIVLVRTRGQDCVGFTKVLQEVERACGWMQDVLTTRDRVGPGPHLPQSLWLLVWTEVSCIECGIPWRITLTAHRTTGARRPSASLARRTGWSVSRTLHLTSPASPVSRVRVTLRTGTKAAVDGRGPCYGNPCRSTEARRYC